MEKFHFYIVLAQRLDCFSLKISEARMRRGVGEELEETYGLGGSELVVKVKGGASSGLRSVSSPV
jgi:hypothetical protein